MDLSEPIDATRDLELEAREDLDKKRKRLKRKQEDDVIDNITDEVNDALTSKSERNSVSESDEDEEEKAKANEMYKEYKKSLDDSTNKFAQFNGIDGNGKESKSSDSSDSSSDDSSSESEREERKAIGGLDDDTPSEDSEGINCESSESQRSSDEEEESEEEENDMKDFIVPDDFEESQEAAPKKRSPKINGNGKKQSNGKNAECYIERVKEDAVSDEEELIEQEYYITESFAPHPTVANTYSNYFEYVALSALAPGYKEYISKEVEADPDTSTNKKLALQLKAETIIVKIGQKIGDLVIGWMFNEITNVSGREHMTLEKVRSILLTEKRTEDGIENLDNIDFVSFKERKFQGINMSTITGEIIAGKPWDGTFIDESKRPHHEVLESKWKNFFLFWTFIWKQDKIIDVITKKHFKDDVLDPFPHDKFKKFAASDIVKTLNRIYVAALAFFYKLLRGTSHGDQFGKDIRHVWFDVTL